MMVLMAFSKVLFYNVGHSPERKGTRNKKSGTIVEGQGVNRGLSSAWPTYVACGCHVEIFLS